MPEIRARDLHLRNELKENYFAAIQLPQILPEDFGIKFLSRRAIAPLLHIQEILQILGIEPSTFDRYKELCEAVGPYALAPRLVRRLNSKGVLLPENGTLPFTAALDFLTPTRYSLLQERHWTIPEIKDFAQRRSWFLKAWQWDTESQERLRMIQENCDLNLSAWDVLEAMDALESHKNTHLFLWFSSNSAEV